jgi:vacuolar-type H+-ATPase subunit H
LNRKFFCLELEYDFKIKIQEYVAKLDSEKAGLLAQLEKELNARQELILESARKRIDDLNEEANRLKMVYPANFLFLWIFK